jgi:SAM-dependent methyltransferase
MISGAPGVEISRPVPGLWKLLQDVLKLQAQDALNVRDGLYPAPIEEGGTLSSHIEAVLRLFADLPQSAGRRAGKRTDEAAALPEAEGLPAYYAQNFHYQSGGYLTEESAKLYDVQVETLFMGAAGAMRRQAIPPIAKFVRGRDQRQLSLLDVACGSGRFLHQLVQAFPAMQMTGTDLSQAYLAEAARYLHGRRTVRFQQANAEALPFEAASFDIVTCVYLYHELPNEVRRQVTAEIALLPRLSQRPARRRRRRVRQGWVAHGCNGSSVSIEGDRLQQRVVGSWEDAPSVYSSYCLASLDFRDRIRILAR